LSVGQAFLALSANDRELSLGSGSHWAIGREKDNAFVFDDSAMSRRHALIQQMQDKFFFIDLGSRNGSLVNGRRVTVPLELRDGDSVTCGKTQFTFRNPSAEPGTAPVQERITDATIPLYTPNWTTVLVVDIRGFTPLTREIGEAILAQTIGTWFREAGKIVKRHGSSGDKYIGDAVMATWTHQTRTPKSVEMQRVLQALWEIHVVTNHLQEQFSLPVPVRIGAGINTGLCMVGNTGGQDTPEFSPLGDSVNAAFRLESATRKTELDIALGRDTFERLGDTPEIQACFEKRLVELKGYENAVDVWFTSFAKLGSALRSRKRESSRASSSRPIAQRPR